MPRIVGYGGIGVRIAVILGRSGSADSDSRFAVRYPYPLSTARTGSIAVVGTALPHRRGAGPYCDGLHVHGFAMTSEPIGQGVSQCDSGGPYDVRCYQADAVTNCAEEIRLCGGCESRAVGSGDRLARLLGIRLVRGALGAADRDTRRRQSNTLPGRVFLHSLNNGMPRVAFSPGRSHRRAVFIRKLVRGAFGHAPRWP